MQVKKKTDGKVYAMKILKKAAIIARNQVEHTKAERKILQALQHPFLMTLRYAFQSKDKLYFVLDYYQGGELFFHLKTARRFPEDVARVWVGEVALALGHLHSLSVIYRDLKPENILLDDNGHCCLTDFGLSKDVDPNDKAHTFCGTPEYLAPEIVTGAGHDKAVDWWSLGILLYELTVGIPPFYSQNVNEMYNKIQHGVLRFPPFLSEPCKAMIVALLNRDPKKRLGSKADIDDLKAHAFFKDINFEKMMKKEIDPPYKPKIKANDTTSNFDTTFTSEPVVDSVAQPSGLGTLSENPDAFAGFTYQQKGSHLTS
jgi:serine/threonine protein kinase